jgi:hypothetical protein
MAQTRVPSRIKLAVYSPRIVRLSHNLRGTGIYCHLRGGHCKICRITEKFSASGDG